MANQKYNTFNWLSNWLWLLISVWKCEVHWNCVANFKRSIWYIYWKTASKTKKDLKKTKHFAVSLCSSPWYLSLHWIFNSLVKPSWKQNPEYPARGLYLRQILSRSMARCRAQTRGAPRSAPWRAGPCPFPSELAGLPSVVINRGGRPGLLIHRRVPCLQPHNTQTFYNGLQLTWYWGQREHGAGVGGVGLGGCRLWYSKISTELLASMEVKEETRSVILPGMVFQCERGCHCRVHWNSPI